MYIEYDRCLEKELHALSGIMKLKYIKKYQNCYTKFKKTEFQTRVLKKIYEITDFPSSNTKRDLAILLSMPEKSIQVWFQNSRQANKKSKSQISQSKVFNIQISEIFEIIKNVTNFDK